MADESLEDESSSQVLKKDDQMSEDPIDNDVEDDHSEDKEKPTPSMTLSSSTQKKVIKNQNEEIQRFYEEIKALEEKKREL